MASLDTEPDVEPLVIWVREDGRLWHIYAGHDMHPRLVIEVAPRAFGYALTTCGLSLPLISGEIELHVDKKRPRGLLCLTCLSGGA